MSDINTYLNYQFSGIFNQSIINGIQDSFEFTNTLIDYLNNVSIDNAVEQECEWIGLWIGFPRPYIPEEFLEDNAFLFYSLADRPDLPELPADFPVSLSRKIESPQHGFSSLANPLTGGRLISLTLNQVKLPLDIYKALLKKIAFIKWYGWNFFSLDNLCQIAGVNYEFEFIEKGDINVVFDTDIHPTYVYILNIIFGIFMTLPRVNIVQGG